MSNLTARQNVCKFIDEWLTKNNVNNNAFAKALGVTNNSVMRWRARVCAPDIDLFPKLCEYMDVSTGDLLGFKPDNDVTLNEINILNTYNTDTSFKALIDLYLADDDVKQILDLLIKKIG